MVTLVALAVVAIGLQDKPIRALRPQAVNVSEAEDEATERDAEAATGGITT